MKRFVVIHGGAGSTPGAVAADFAGVIGITRARQRTAWADGHSFVEIADIDHDRSVLEVNWTDLRKASASMWGVLRHILYMVTSMLDVAAAPLSGISGRVVRLYRILLFSATPGAVCLLIMGAIAFTIEDTGLRRLLLIVLAGGFAVLAVYLQRFGKHFRWIWLWLVPILALVITAMPRPLAETSRFVPLIGEMRKDWFVGVLVGMDLAAVAEIVHWRRAGIAVQASYVSLLYVPYIVSNAVMTWLTLLTMGFLSRFRLYPKLEGLSPLPGLDRFERAATIVFGTLGMLALVLPLLLYFRPGNTNDKKP